MIAAKFLRPHETGQRYCATADMLYLVERAFEAAQEDDCASLRMTAPAEDDGFGGGS
jgi:hypothetical protein